MRNSSGNRVPFVVLGVLLTAACNVKSSERVDPTDPVTPLGLSLTKVQQLTPQSGRNSTAAVDPRSGAVYLVWAQESPGTVTPSTPRPDPVVQVFAARSDDRGSTFGAPVRVSAPGDDIGSSTVSPPQVAVGSRGEVLVVYERRDQPSGWYKGEGWYSVRTLLRLARSDDGGKTFSAPVDIGGEATEGERTTLGMLNLHVAPDGDVFVSWLDFRELMTYVLANRKAPPPEERTATQLRVARSSDGGRTFAKSALVSEPTCECCGTKVVQGASGPLYAATRGESRELKGSYDAVRDLFVSTSNDDGATWSSAVKFHDDRFKVSGCPDITPGLGVDTKGRLHAAWYTGTERSPGVHYARSDDQGKTFSPPVALLTGEWIPYADVKLAVDAADHAWIAFEDRRGDQDLIQVVRVSPDGTIARSTTWPGTAPDIASVGDGAIVTWRTQAADDAQAGGAIEWLMARPAGGS